MSGIQSTSSISENQISNKRNEATSGSSQLNSAGTANQRNRSSLTTSTPIASGRLINTSSPSVSSVRSVASNENNNQPNSVTADAVLEKAFHTLVAIDPQMQTAKKILENKGVPDIGQISSPKKKTKKMRNKGAAWNSIKPKYRGCLYYKIVSNLSQVQIFASKWCDHYKLSKESAVTELQQLFIDMTGLQSFGLEELYQENGRTIEPILKMLEKKITELDSMNTYLCNYNHPWGSQCLDAISDFLKIVWSFGVFDCYMTVEILPLIKAMASSNVRIIRHTGAFLAAKLLTFTSEEHLKLKKDLKKIKNISLDPNLPEEDLRKLLKCQEMTSEIIKYLFYLVEKNCTLEDESLSRMRLQCVKEIQYWFKNVPEIAFAEFFNLILVLIEDRDAHMRQAALSISQYLVSNHKFSKLLTPLIDNLLTKVKGRVWDVNYDAAVNALEVLSIALDNYPEHVDNKTAAFIMKEIFSNHYPLARAAGSFAIKCFKNGEPDAKRMFIYNLVEFVKRYLDLMPLLIEAVVDICEEIQDYELLMNILLTEENTLEDDRVLINIMTQTVIQTITQKSPLKREKSREGKITKSQIQDIVQVFIPKLNALIKTFSSDNLCIQMFCEMLLVFEFEETTLIKYNKEFDELFRLLIRIFVRTADEKIQLLISQIFLKLMKESLSISKRAKEVFSMVLDKSVEVYKFAIEEYTSGEYDVQTLNLEIHLQRLEVLFQKHNLTTLLDWSSLFFHWDSRDEIFTSTVICRSMKCCYWFLTWQILTLRDVKENIQQQVAQIKKKCSDVIDRCLSAMSENQDDLTILRTAFEVVADLTLLLVQAVSIYVEKKERYRQLFLQINNVQAQEILVNYVLIHVLPDKSKETLKTRREHLGKLVNMFLEGIMPYKEYLPKIYKYYHECFEDYEDIFNRFLDFLRNVAGIICICALVLQTIKYCYNEYMSLTEVFDSNSKEVEQIRALAKQLYFYLRHKEKADTITALLKRAIEYSTSAPEKGNFLYFFCRFTSFLSESARKDVLRHFKNKISREDETRQVFIKFFKHLTEKKVRGRFVKQLPSSARNGTEADDRGESDEIEEISENLQHL